MRQTVPDRRGGQEEENGTYGLAFPSPPAQQRGREEGHAPELVRGQPGMLQLGLLPVVNLLSNV